jgi:hypothetical protein
MKKHDNKSSEKRNEWQYKIVIKERALKQFLKIPKEFAKK